ncbi:hypothetical protein ATANTOWER_010617, partial [Ataeniobius toweri]|nr:hypothetical protein [Ataeniobius toweri]
MKTKEHSRQWLIVVTTSEVHQNSRWSTDNQACVPLVEYLVNLSILGVSWRYGKIVSTKAILDKNTNQCK